MSSILRIEKTGLDQLVAALVARHRLFGPVDADGATVWREVRSADELALGRKQTDEPAKAVFYPQTEVLLGYDRGEVEAPAGESRPIAVLGVRPCDSRSLLTLDRVLGTGKYEDPGWVRRRSDALVIGLGCNEPSATCFCDWFGAGPFSREGSDIMLTDKGGAFIAESCTDNGEKFLRAAYGARLQRPSDDDLAEAGRVRQTALDALGSAPRAEFSLQSTESSLSRAWESPLWDELAFECLGCAACSYLCPTCHCFDVQDETEPGSRALGSGVRGRRIRIWDTCTAALFTREASGHNPRPTGRERFRQRVMHKFRYFVENYGEAGCVGCGRCIRGCPAGIDIREVLERVGAEGTKAQNSEAEA